MYQRQQFTTSKNINSKIDIVEEVRSYNKKIEVERTRFDKQKIQKRVRKKKERNKV